MPSLIDRYCRYTCYSTIQRDKIQIYRQVEQLLPNNHEKVNENVTWAKEIVFPDFSLTLINSIESSHTISSFPRLFEKKPIFQVFEDFQVSMNPVKVLCEE